MPSVLARAPRLLPLAFATGLPLRPLLSARVVAAGSSERASRTRAPRRRARAHAPPRAVMAPASAADVLAAPRVSGLAVAGGPPLGADAADVLVVAVWAPAPAADGPAADAKPDADDDAPAWDLPAAVTDALGADAAGALADAAADAGFSAKAGSSTGVVRVTGAGSPRIVLYGLGDPGAEAAMVTVANAAAFAVGKAAAIKACRSAALALVGDGPGVADDAIVAKLVEGAQVAAYTDERYKEKKTEASKMPDSFVVMGAEGTDIKKAIARGVAIAAGIVTTKEVVAAPANYLNPTTMAQAAKNIASEEGLECKVLGRAECEKLGMGSYLGVAQGADTDPQFIHMVYKPEGGAKKKLAIIGKSVCHDTGGYNLKAGPGSMIELMKWDMGGGGTTLGVARAIGQIKPPGVEVHFIMPAVLNLVSSSAYLPGDILTASNGKTIEVLNTDAEGRLCLCDAIVYAEKVVGGMDAVVDIATLTGAVIVALGNNIAGLWSTSDKLAGDLVDAAKGTEDKMWRMPLPDEYAEQLKSKIADLRNIGVGRAASSITAALFLKEFVETKEWAHLDIAGTAWSDKKGGATGYGVRTLCNWIESHSQ